MAESEKHSIRLSKAAKEFNVGLSTIVEFLFKKGHPVESNPNTKISSDLYDLLDREFQSQKSVMEEAKKIGLDYSSHQTISLDDKKSKEKFVESEDDYEEIFIKQLSISKKQKESPAREAEETEVKNTTEKVVKKEAEEKIASKKEAEISKPKVAEEEIIKEVEKEPEAEVIDGKSKESHKHPEPVTEGEAIEEISQEKIDIQPKIIGKIDLDSMNFRTKPPRKSAAEKKKERDEKYKGKKTGKRGTEKVVDEPQTEKTTPEESVKQSETDTRKVAEEINRPEPEDPNFIRARADKLEGVKVVDKIELPVEKKKSDRRPVATSKDIDLGGKKKRRKRIKKKPEQLEGQEKEAKPQDNRPRPPQQRLKDRRTRREREKPEISEDDIQQQIKETLAKLTGVGKSKASKYRREKRQSVSILRQKELEKIAEEKNIIKVTEFVTANELANLMNVQVNEIISTCMSLGLFVSINQRLDAETLALVAEEFGYKLEFVSADFQESIEEVIEEDNPEDLMPRAPIVTVMGHVDHGKTKLLDFIRKANVVEGEAGGITQHIGAYEFVLEGDKKITFLDTPGHEAFTAMRARGAKVTDVAIIVVAADDDVMPQTVEAINHAQAAGVPIVFAINKIDKPTANPDKIKDELSKMNILVEEWGGKYQSQDISAKQGINIDVLLEKVLLEAEMLDLKANPDKLAHGTVIESSLDKGRGYVAKLLVQDGTLKTGDIVLAGSTFGRVKAMYNERNQKVVSAGPSTPLLLLGLNGAPQAGDVFKVLKDEKEAKSIASRRQQLQREQGIRTQKHITLDEIGRRIAIGDFKELNIIVKGDVDGSVEALSDSLLKLSNEQVQVNIIHKSVGAVTETDVMLASASDAVIIAFQVRPSVSARKLAEQEQIDIRLYSIIYQAIEEIKAAIEGMLSPEIEEKIICNVEVREIFKITKVGTVAGCMVLDGTITRNTRVRIIRDGIVVYTGLLGSLKRFKDDVKEVKVGYECGLNIENYNDIKIGDIIEGYEEVEIKKKLS
jgi:translation initiation factor IF-2